MAYFSSPSEREDIRATTNEILDTCGTIAAVHAKNISQTYVATVAHES